MDSDAGTSWASTPTTTNAPLIEESSEEDKLVKSSIVVPSPSDTAGVTPAIIDEAVAKKEEIIGEPVFSFKFSPVPPVPCLVSGFQLTFSITPFIEVYSL